MPCPFFEPQRPLVVQPGRAVRLPLIEEYTGICHAVTPPVEAPEELRFRCCNHGYSHNVCGHFPPHETRSCSRFDVIERSHEMLNVLYVEERNYAPARWQAIIYRLGTDALEPEVTDACVRAQLLAFCHSFLTRFPS